MKNINKYFFSLAIKLKIMLYENGCCNFFAKNGWCKFLLEKEIKLYLYFGDF